MALTSHLKIGALGRMTRLLPLLTAAVVAATGCATVVRSTGKAPYPANGTYMLYARDGRLLQRSDWRAGKLLSAWEHDEEGRWTRVATAGKGRLTYFEEDGREYGWADFYRGEYWRGAH
jgi:hypothetical protein